MSHSHEREAKVACRSPVPRAAAAAAVGLPRRPRPRDGTGVPGAAARDARPARADASVGRNGAGRPDHRALAAPAPPAAGRRVCLAHSPPRARIRCRRDDHLRRRDRRRDQRLHRRQRVRVPSAAGRAAGRAGVDCRAGQPLRVAACPVLSRSAGLPPRPDGIQRHRRLRAGDRLAERRQLVGAGSRRRGYRQLLRDAGPRAGGRPPDFGGRRAHDRRLARDRPDLRLLAAPVPR